MYLIYPAQVALIYNSAILISVTLNLDWAKARAAGGQFESFPPAIRVIYFLMFLGMLFLINFLWRYRQDRMSQAAVRLARILGYLFIVSTITQLLSKSSAERLNALPAAIIALTFLLLAARNRNK